MKEFDNWWNDDWPSKIPNGVTTWEYKAFYSGCELGWKAALNWAHSQGYRADGQGSLESVIFNELEE